MGQGCSSSLGGIVDTSRSDRWAESPDLVMREIVHNSVATIRDLRKKAHQERFGGYSQHKALPESNGQEHLLFHNLVFQEKQQLKTGSSNNTNNNGSTMRDTCDHNNHNKAHNHPKQRRGRKIAESFEAERQNAASATVEQELPAWQQQQQHNSNSNSNSSSTSGETQLPVVVSEAALEDFEIDLASHMERACPTRLWVRRRSLPKKRKLPTKKRSATKQQQQQQKQQQQNTPEQRPTTDNADSAPVEPPEVVLLEEGQSYRKNKDYFGLQSSSTCPNQKTAGPEPSLHSTNNGGNSNPHSSTHIYAIRYSENGGKNFTIHNASNHKKYKQSKKESSPLWIPVTDDEATIAGMFSQANMALPPERDVVSWTTVSEEHDIYIVDLGLTPKNCDDLVTTTEQACRGRYAAYTYAKQTLGCKEYPLLAKAALGPVHSMVGAITDKFDGMGPDQKARVARAKAQKAKAAAAQAKLASNTTTTKAQSEKEPETTTSAVVDSSQDQTKSSSDSNSGDGDQKDASEPTASEKPAGLNASPKTIAPPLPQKQILQLDDREPHIVKYDVTKKERQKLDMHTDKSEWTFLIALSNGCGLDYEGGGTYFECLDATVHIQKGHALVFPGKLRHKGQAIHHGLRFLLVGFLIDKGEKAATAGAASDSSKVGDSTTVSNTAGNGKQEDLAKKPKAIQPSPYVTPMVAAA